MAEEKDGATVADTVATKSESKVDFNTVRARAQELWLKLVGTGDDAKPDVANAILKKIEITMGRRMKLSEFTEDQADLLALVVLDMEEMAK